ncbi:hypothetical protein ATANTOWER_002383 [Ataeniobius toweri]|uniref:Secreted protein n=1 Tax=Ataeniobius toweri TaxID=208326 RepID=A0ABU7A9N1_9TELE|nr:hypothetical protein [Ataeniobius toweri]
MRLSGSGLCVCVCIVLATLPQCFRWCWSSGGQVRLILLIAWRSTLAGGCQLFDARVFAYCGNKTKNLNFGFM